MAQNYRALHYVLKIGDRKSAIKFFKETLGMKVLRHEEFEKGCEATCNGPYDGRWSKTMIGYGPEDNHFVLELTYNYGISSYRHGNALHSIEIQKENLSLLKEQAENVETDGSMWLKNNGYKFHVYPGPVDKITRVNILSGGMERSQGFDAKFYENILGMKLLNADNSDETLLSYGEDQASLGLRASELSKVDHGTAFGRTAFACPTSDLPLIEEKVKQVAFQDDIKPKILTPLISLDTPGKATVSVVIVADLSGHEICFVGEEGFKDLSQVDENADAELTKKLEEDKSDEWFAKRGKSKEESK